MRDIVLYATDTMADWEYAYLTAGIGIAQEQAPGRFRLRVLSDHTVQVTTIGGLRLLPDGDLSDSAPADIALLVLPGGQTWHEGHERVLALAQELRTTGTPVAAICGATYALARAGLLDDHRHTSNARDFLESSGYAAGALYQDERTVDHDGLITAGACFPVDFAAAAFRRLELFPEPVIEAWYGLYTTGEQQYFDELVGNGR